MSSEHVYSHGRGGQGNIGPDNTEYVDGEIHREEDPTVTGGAYSTGRGGAANIGSPKLTPKKTKHDEDVVPEVAKVHPDETYHAGRGGEGNAVIGGKKAEEKKKNAHNGLVDKVKKRLSAVMAKFK